MDSNAKEWAIFEFLTSPIDQDPEKELSHEIADNVQRDADFSKSSFLGIVCKDLGQSFRVIVLLDGKLA